MLFHAVRAKNIAVMEKLMAHGIQVNAQNHNKRTPLSIAIEGKDEHVLKLLLGHGVDANAPGKHALKLAKKLNNTGFQNVLEMNGAKEKTRRPHQSRQRSRGSGQRMEKLEVHANETEPTPNEICCMCGSEEDLRLLVPCEHACVCEKCVRVFAESTDRCPVCKLTYLASKKRE